MTDESGVSVSEVSAVAIAVGESPASLEQFVAELPADRVAPFLARLIDAATNIRALIKGLEQRLMADGLTGQHFTVNGVEYGFFGAQAKGWKDIPNLYANLRLLGFSEADLSGAISETRVTDLRTAANALRDEEKRTEALALIEGARFDKGARGTPSFKPMDEIKVIR